MDRSVSDQNWTGSEHGSLDYDRHGGYNGGDQNGVKRIEAHFRIDDVI
jgi:hypothetical protein